MFKIIGWLGRTLITAAIVSLLSAYVAWSTVQLYAEKLMKQFSLGSVTDQTNFSEVLAKLSQNLNILKQPPASQTEKEATAAGSGATSSVDGSKPVSGSISGQSDTSGSLSTGRSGETPGTFNYGDGTSTATNGWPDTGTTGGTGSGSATPGANQEQMEHVPDNAIPVWSQTSTMEGTAQQDKMVMSTEGFAKMKDTMSADDKMKVFTILVGRLPENELQKLSAYVEDGITNEEMTEIEATVKKYVTPEEMDQLMEILNKY